MSGDPIPSASLSENEDDDDPFSDEDLQLASIMADVVDRIQRGLPVELDDECKKYPDLSGSIKRLWGTIMVTEAIGRSHGDEAKHPLHSDSGSWQLKLPCSWGEYELIEELGRGGMGIVFLAEQPRLGRQVAIKMILRDRFATEQERLRFFAEAEALAKLEHPGIVPVFEVGELQGSPYFTMQYVRGTTLAHRLADGPLPQRAAARIISQVARAVHFAHQRGILHRDIKPSNILVDEQGNARLTDFGLAKQADAAESLTRTGAVLGTPTYMSPEQASGRSSSMGPASDVYSIGTVLYHSLTGRPPHVADSPVQLALKVLEQDPPAPRLLEPSIDRDLEMIVVRCLQKPPDLRYDSSQDLAMDLEAFLRDEPIAARSGQLAQVVARVFRETHHAPILENWGLLWMWHSLVLLIACGLTWGLQQSGTQQRWPYAALWIVGLGAWAMVFWVLRRRMGPVTFVERQIAHVWGASMIAIGTLFPLEWWMNLPPLSLSPLLGIISGMIFVVKAGILSGAFYIQAACLFACAAAMAVFPSAAHLIFGIVAAGCFFIPGLKYYRRTLVDSKGTRKIATT